MTENSERWFMEALKYAEDEEQRERSRATASQPPPMPNNKPAVWDLVTSDFEARDRFGRAKYGTPLQPHNGRDTLADLYQELLDAVVYTRTLIYERDGK